MATESRRIGITMRESMAIGYDERRDALARDWARWMATALPAAAWLPIPNLGDDAVDFCVRWQLDGLILSGGDDIGASPQRDTTENALLQHFVASGLPVLGICRGLQMLWSFHGGKLSPIAAHAAKRHMVTVVSAEWRERLRTDGMQVNSFHGNGLSGLPPAGFDPVALAEDGSIEAVWHPQARLLGIMWHPEREMPAREFDLAMVRWLFRNEMGEQR